jgi:CS domain
MSRLSDYSKFDHLEEEDDDDNDCNNSNSIGTATGNSDSSGAVPIHESNQHQLLTTNISKSTPMVGAGATLRLKETKHYTDKNNLNNNIQLPQQQEQRYRIIYEYNRQPIYEWEQGLTDVIIYVYCPPLSVNQQNRYRSSDFICKIQPSSIQLGLRVSSNSTNQTYFINELTYEKVDVHESTWTIEDMDDNNDKNDTDTNQQLKQQCIVFYLQKVAKGSVWKAALRGQPIPNTATTASTATTTMVELDPYIYQLVQQQILKERWQEENPSMDFTSATFNGSSVPDPRTFMGGVRY